MALRDTWHRALVYFGLAEEHPHYYDERERDYYEPETGTHGVQGGYGAPGGYGPQGGYGASPSYEPPPARTATVSRLGDRRRSQDEIDDIFSDDAPPRRGGGALRPVTNGADVRVHLVTPNSFNDAQEIADRFKRGVPVILNLQTTGAEMSKRLIDFSSGLTYALDGGMQKVADKTFMLTPRNVEVSAEQRARLIEKGFFNQS